MTAEFFIDDEPCSKEEFVRFQMKAQVLYGNTYLHTATWPEGRTVIQAISPERVTVDADGQFRVSPGRYDLVWERP